MIKFIFHILNIIIIFLYVYPGSILGFFFYGDFGKQPQITTDFISLSSNHVYAFALLSILGFINYYKSHKYLIVSYLFIVSIILEGLHLLIPNRGFQFSDLFGNIVGVLLPIIIINIYNFWRKK